MHSVEIVGWCALWMACGLIIIAAVDVPFQLWDNKQKLMMTKQEVKDEYKDSEGKPEVKSRIRQLQREAAQRRMMQAVPEADVVITNPTHFAVALKYDGDKGGAPRLVAKGGDFVALKIREIAQEHKVTVLESPALARAVYYSTELDQKSRLVSTGGGAGAGVRLSVASVPLGQGRRPDPLNNLPIPRPASRRVIRPGDWRRRPATALIRLRRRRHVRRHRPGAADGRSDCRRPDGPSAPGP